MDLSGNFLMARISGRLAGAGSGIQVALGWETPVVATHYLNLKTVSLANGRCINSCWLELLRVFACCDNADPDCKCWGLWVAVEVVVPAYQTRNDPLEHPQVKEVDAVGRVTEQDKEPIEPAGLV